MVEGLQQASLNLLIDYDFTLYLLLGMSLQILDAIIPELIFLSFKRLKN